MAQQENRWRQAKGMGSVPINPGEPFYRNLLLGIGRRKSTENGYQVLDLDEIKPTDADIAEADGWLARKRLANGEEDIQDLAKAIALGRQTLVTASPGLRHATDYDLSGGVRIAVLSERTEEGVTQKKFSGPDQPLQLEVVKFMDHDKSIWDNPEAVEGISGD